MESRIFKGVTLGEGTVVEDFCVIGSPPRGRADGELETIIGPDSVIRSHAVIYAGNRIGSRFQTGNKLTSGKKTRLVTTSA